MPRLFAALLFVAFGFPLGVLVLADKYALEGAAIVGAFTVGASLLIGLPLALWFVRRGWLRLWQAATAGAAAGAIVASIVVSDPLGRSPLEIYLTLSGFGSLHGVAFWLLAFFKNGALTRRKQDSSSSGGIESVVFQETSSK